MKKIIQFNRQKINNFKINDTRGTVYLQNVSQYRHCSPCPYENEINLKPEGIMGRQRIRRKDCWNDKLNFPLVTLS
uniref:ISL3 family transposase n=1 Tax=Panagrolaimus sp. JU765 TaxID=591449 RepID=A0AC34QI01_9BILA